MATMVRFADHRRVIILINEDVDRGASLITTCDVLKLSM
jgi:hypothetical protein